MPNPGPSTDNITHPIPAPTPTHDSNHAPPTSFRRHNDQPMDPLKSFLRWSTSTTHPSEPEGRSTWSFHPSEYDPDAEPIALSIIPDHNNDIETDKIGETGERKVNVRASYGTFGRGGKDADDSPGKDKTEEAGDVDGVRREAVNEELGRSSSELPGTVLKFNRDMRRSNQSKPSPKYAVPDSTSTTRSSASSDDETPHVHFGTQPLQTIEGSPSAIRSSPGIRHRPAASTSNLETIYARPPTAYLPRTRTRSKSIDSISLNPSISDSVTGLLMPITMSSRPLQVYPSTLPKDLVAKNDLNPEQRAILLRRAKKLEQLLGQSLDEKSIEQLLIDPIHASRTITTDVSEQAWPDSPTRTGRGKAEWQKEDVVPRKGKLVDTSTPTPTHGGLGRSGSFIARTARAALGLMSGGEKDKDKDLAVYVSREVRVSETGVRGAKPKSRHSLSTPPGNLTSHSRFKQNSLPASPGRDEWEMEDGEMNEDDASRKTRRLQLAKVFHNLDDVDGPPIDNQLHRLLGVAIPPDLVSRQSSTSVDREQDRNQESSTPQAKSPNQEGSYIVMDDTLITPSPSWSAMLKNTLSLGLTRARRSSSPGRFTPIPCPAPTLLRGESFVDLSTMNDKEKASARRKAQKLEYMFGDPPPQTMFLTNRPSTPSNSDTPITTEQEGQTTHESFTAYQQSLTNLLYLADNDSATLDILMDRLDLDSEQDHDHDHDHDSAHDEVDQDPEEGQEDKQGIVNSHEIRRKRTGKLSHFFGETGIDFNDPPNVATTMERVRSRTATPCGHAGSGGKSKDTLDEMMREMWRVVQSEVKRGGMAVKDGERLGELIDKLRFKRGGRVKLD